MYFPKDKQCFHYFLILFNPLIPVYFLIPLVAITNKGDQHASTPGNVLYLFGLFHTAQESWQTSEDLWQPNLPKNPQREQQCPVAAE
jgi:hypothetical protein